MYMKGRPAPSLPLNAGLAQDDNQKFARKYAPSCSHPNRYFEYLQHMQTADEMLPFQNPPTKYDMKLACRYEYFLKANRMQARQTWEVAGNNEPAKGIVIKAKVEEIWQMYR